MLYNYFSVIILMTVLLVYSFRLVCSSIVMWKSVLLVCWPDSSIRQWVLTRDPYCLKFLELLANSIHFSVGELCFFRLSQHHWAQCQSWKFWILGNSLKNFLTTFCLTIVVYITLLQTYIFMHCKFKSCLWVLELFSFWNFMQF